MEEAHYQGFLMLSHYNTSLEADKHSPHGFYKKIIHFRLLKKSLTFPLGNISEPPKRNHFSLVQEYI